MSATLGTYLRELEPEWSMTMVERLEGVAQESSNGWNNAGTGHSALMELNYTPQNADGSISIEKAVAINEAFQISRQFWAHQVERGVLRTPRSFINTVPHMSFVWGEDNVNFLRARYAALQQSSLFRGMRYSEDHAQIKEWAPLVMEGRDPQQKVAATRTEIGTDVNYGEITRQLIASLQKKSNFSLQLSSEVRALKRNDDNSWTVTVADLKNGNCTEHPRQNFVFIGAGRCGAENCYRESGDSGGEKTTLVSRWADSSLFRKTRTWLITIWRRFTVKHPLAHHRCRFRISIPVFLTVNA